MLSSPVTQSCGSFSTFDGAESSFDLGVVFWLMVGERHRFARVAKVFSHPEHIFGDGHTLAVLMFRPLNLRRLARGALIVVGLLPAGSFAADPQPYAVTLQPTNQGPLDTALRDSSNLI